MFQKKQSNPYQHQQVTQSQLQDLKSAFFLFDKNGDGAIQKHELKAVLQSIGVHPSESDLSDMMAQCDLDNNGSIQFDQFVYLMQGKLGYAFNSSKTLPDDQLKQVFKMFDLDGNGFVSPEQLRHVMEKLGENLTDEELQDMIIKADKDGDGQINFMEFKYIMNHL